MIAQEVPAVIAPVPAEAAAPRSRRAPGAAAAPARRKAAAKRKRARGRKPAAVPSAKRRRKGRAGRRTAKQTVPRRPLPAQEAESARAAEGETRAPHGSAYEEAVERARYEGGELLLEQAAPPGYSLADISLQEAIAAGVEALRHRLAPVMDAAGVCDAVEAALAEGRPVSVVRLGDGELLALAQDVALDSAYIRRAAPFLAQSGVDVPDHAARARLADAVRRATIVGVPLARRPHFGPLVGPALSGNGIDVRALRLTESTVNYTLQMTGLLGRLLQGRRILVAGNAAHGLGAKLAEAGFAVTAVISPVRGFADIDRVLAEAAAVADRFDVALVAAGIPAVVLAADIAERYGKAAIDFGHLADQIAGGQARLV